jgi:hypothetical protein
MKTYLFPIIVHTQWWAVVNAVMSLLVLVPWSLLVGATFKHTIKIYVDALRNGLIQIICNFNN